MADTSDKDKAAAKAKIVDDRFKATGILLFFIMFCVFIFIKEFPLALFLVPAFLIGLDMTKNIGSK